MRTNPGGEPPEDTEGLDNSPDDIEDLDLENEEAEDPEGGDQELAEDERDAGGDRQEPDETQGQARDVGGRRARGRAYGEQLRERDARIAAQDQRIADFERQLREVVNQPRQPSAAERAAEAEAERARYEMMSPWEQAQYTEQKIAQRVNQQVQQVSMTMWDQSDRREYTDLLDRHPVVSGMNARARGEVEATVTDLKTQAPTVPRSILLETAIGRYVMKHGALARNRSARDAGAAAARNSARPSQGRGDVSPQRGRRGDDLEERLRNASI